MPSSPAGEPVWVTVAELVEINRQETAHTGEPHGLLNPSLLESAWGKPINRWAYERERISLAWRSA